MPYGETKVTDEIIDHRIINSRPSKRFQGGSGRTRKRRISPGLGMRVLRYLTQLLPFAANLFLRVTLTPLTFGIRVASDRASSSGGAV